MKVPLLQLNNQHQALDPELQKAFRGVLDHGKFILGPEVDLFEKEVAIYCQAKHAISCASGSDALLLALMALDIRPGDEVITSPYSFFATASCIARLGAKAVFADICLGCYNLDPNEVVKKISPSTKAIIPVHLYGQSAEMEPYLSLAKEKGISVIEDAAQAIGATYKNKMVGPLGDIGCLSFFPSKNLGGFGDGGMLLTNNDSLAEKLQILRVHGSKPKYYHQVLGINSRLDTLQAALLRVKLPHLNKYAESRNRNASLYNKLFIEAGLASLPLKTNCPSSVEETKPVLLPGVYQSKHVYNQYVIRLKDPKKRDSLRKYLESKDIGTEIYYPVPLHLQKCFSDWSYQAGDFPKSELASAATLALPIYPELAEDQIRYVAKSIIDFQWNS